MDASFGMPCDRGLHRRMLLATESSSAVVGGGLGDFGGWGGEGEWAGLAFVELCAHATWWLRQVRWWQYVGLGRNRRARQEASVHVCPFTMLCRDKARGVHTGNARGAAGACAVRRRRPACARRLEASARMVLRGACMESCALPFVPSPTTPHGTGSHAPRATSCTLCANVCGLKRSCTMVM